MLLPLPSLASDRVGAPRLGEPLPPAGDQPCTQDRSAALLKVTEVGLSFWPSFGTNSVAIQVLNKHTLSVLLTSGG